jgi:hypothetical protein
METFFLVLIAMGTSTLILGAMWNGARFAPEPKKPDLYSVRNNAAAIKYAPVIWRIGAGVITFGVVGLILSKLLGIE